MSRMLATLLLTLVLLLPAPAALSQTSDDDGVASQTCGPDCFRDGDGNWMSASIAYKDFTHPGKPHYLRAALEMSAFILGGTVWYWADRERNVADWDFPSVKQRFTFDAWRFDNNEFAVNYFFHPGSGLWFHAFSRSNNLSLPASIGFGFATSFLWEFALEFREKVSINDLLVTTGAGIALGEFAHWLGRYLRCGEDASVARRVAQYTVGAPQTMHDALDHKSGCPKAGEISHRFEFSYGVALPTLSGDAQSVGAGDVPVLHQLRFDGRLMAIPGYRRPGRFSLFFADGNVTSLHAQMTASGDGTGFDLLGDTMLLGLYTQRFSLDGVRAGTALALGTSMAFHYRSENVGDWSDRFGILHLPGLAVDAELIRPGWALFLSARAHPDFVGINALTYDRWKAVNPGAMEKTILGRDGYYFGWGVSGRLSARLEFAHGELGGSLAYGRYYSQEGLDRTEEDVVGDVASDDTVLDLEAWLRFAPDFAPFRGEYFVEFRSSRQQRHANLGGFAGELGLTRHAIQIGTVF